jgi:release factor glutamine methyltransferase
MDKKNLEINGHIKNFFEESGLEDPMAEFDHLRELIPEGDIQKVLEEENLSLEHFCEKRKTGIPVEYIIHRAQFRNRIFFCDYGALIPREETELLVEKTLEKIEKDFPGNNGINLLDVGIGCGNISISIALEDGRIDITGLDISSDALEVTRKNLEKFGLTERVNLVKSDLFSSIENGKKFHAIVCNPPYIPSNSLKNLAPSILDHEPILALDAGHFGLDIYLRLIEESPRYLIEGGFLAMEIGEGQEKMVTRILRKDGNYSDITKYEYDEIVRVVIARLNN